MKLKVSSVDLRQETEASVPAKRRWGPLDWLHWMRQHPHVVALVGYVVLTLAITFPLILHLQDSIVGPVMYGDSMWYTWYSYAFRQAVLAGQDPSTTHLLYALLPQIQLFAASEINGIIGAILLSFLTPLAVFNILILLNFILSGFTTYLLVNEFVPNRWAAFIAGCMYTFSTYHFWRVISGLSLTSMQWMPLAALCVFTFYRRPTWRNAVFMGISLALMPLSDLYLPAYFVPMFALVFIVGLLVTNRAWLTTPQHLVRAVVGLAITAVISLPVLAGSFHIDPYMQAAIAAKASSTEHLSSNVLAYFFPSPRNPLFGGLTQRLYRHMFFGVSEETAGYIGTVALALAVFGFIATRKRTRALYFWALLAVVSFVVSLGPSFQVGGHILFKLPFYGWLYNWPILSGFRAPNRIAPIVLVSVCVLAAQGMDVLFERVQRYVNTRDIAVQLRRASVPALGVLVICASLAESIQFSFPYPFTHVPVPVVYQQMAADPVPGLVLTLPVYPKGLDMFYQTVYHRGLVTGYPIRTTYNMIRTFENIPDVSLFNWPDSAVANDKYADITGELHDIFPYQQTLKQGLQENHIRYVVLRSDTTGFTGKVFPPIQPWMRPFLEQRLGAPFYANTAEGLTVWRIDPAAVDPSVTRFKMDDGWTPGLHLFNGQNVRGILQDAELEVYEPQATSVHIVLTATAVTTQQTMAVSVNGAVVKTMVFDQPGEFQAMDLGVVNLQAGNNILHFAGTRQCVDPTATFPATLNTKCLMFQMSSLQMVAPQSR